MSHDINYVAVLVSTVVIFMLGGLWYSPVLFARQWVALQGKTMDEMKASGGASPAMYLQVFLCGFLISWVIAILVAQLHIRTAVWGLHLGALCWVGFVLPTSYGTALFSSKPKMLWAIDSGFNLVSMIVAGTIIGAWR